MADIGLAYAALFHASIIFTENLTAAYGGTCVFLTHYATSKAAGYSGPYRSDANL